MEITTETYFDADQKIWSGPKTERKYNPNTTLGEVILEVLKKNSKKILQISDTTGEERTAAQLLHDSQLIAEYIISLGLNPGDVVGLYAKNSTNVTAVAIATLLCGTPYNSAFPGFDKENVMLVFKITTPKVIFCDIENYDTLKAAVGELELNAKIITINGKLQGVDSVPEILKDVQKNLNIRYPCFDLDGDSTAIVLCSSGTTGGPKGVTCSHSRLLEQQIFLDISSDDITFCFSTLYWISGTFILFSSLLNGAKNIITEQSFTPEYFYYLVDKYKLTHLLIPTIQVAPLVEYGKPDPTICLNSIKAFMTGGTKVHESISQRFLPILGNNHKFIIAYGLTEMGTMVSETSLSTTKSIRYDSEGKLTPKMEARIIDQITGEALGPNKKGLLHVRSPFKWAGYYRNEEATKKAYSNGWLNTADIAYFDNDGFLFICARSSDIFKSNGFFIIPNKLENIILQVPGVAEACVFPKPDFIADYLTACAIVRTDDEAGRLLTEHIILEHVRQHVSEIYHMKGGVFFIKKLPKTASGKVQQRKVYDMIKNDPNGNQ